MKLGAEPKKVVALGALLLVGGYLFYSNVLSEPSGGPRESAPARRAAAPATSTEQASTVTATAARRTALRVRNSEEFRPSMKIRPEDKVDPTSIDPTLRLDVLAKVQGIDMEGGTRNLFQFSTPPPPPALKGPEPKVTPKTPEQIAKEEKEKANPVPAGPPPPPPINLKYYGYSTVRGEEAKKAFFLDGEDILVAAEGDVLKKRYKVVRIGINSVVMEDTESKHQQTLPLQAEAVG